MSNKATPILERPQFAASPAMLEQVTDAELARYAKLVYERTGIRIPPQKKTLLSNRLRRRLRATGITGFSAYYDRLKQLPPRDPEWDAFLQEITTHETYLFRDEGQWKWFREQYVPALLSDVRGGQREASLRIWSAACSTGDEAYTAACCIAAALTNHARWNVWILGSDIGVGAVQQAGLATFGERAMRLVPDSYKRRFFTKATHADVWQAKPLLSNMTTFRQHNLMDPLRERPFDLVFLKNVLIYFDRDSKRKVLENIRATMRSGSLLVAGPADGVSEFVKDYKRHQAWLYECP